MSDESLPEPLPPIDDHAEPTADGYGYYEVEQYTGDPLLRPPDTPDASPDRTAPPRSFDPPALAGRRGFDREAHHEPRDEPDLEPEFDPSAFDPPRFVRPARRTSDPVPFAPPAIRGVDDDLDDDRDADGDADEDDDTHDETDDETGHGSEADDRLPPVVHTGRTPFAERNWRIPTIIALVVAMIVIGAVILLLPDDGIVEDDPSELIEIRTQPSKQWDEDLDGFASGLVSDEDTLYAVVATAATIEVVALDLGDGDERWRTEIGPGSESSIGDIALGDDNDELTVVVASGSAPGVLATLAVETGAIGWQVRFDGGDDPVIIAESLIRTSDPEGGSMFSSIDRAGKQLGAAAPADTYAIDEDHIYVDSGGTLTRRSLDSLEPDDRFRFTHTADIESFAIVAGSPVVAIGEQLVRLDASGTERYTFAPEVGIVQSLFPLNGDAVLVGGAGRMRAVAINGDEAEAITDVRTALSPEAVQEVDGEELIISSIASGSGGAATLRTVRINDSEFEPIAEIGLTGGGDELALVVVGRTAYATSYETTPRFLAADLTDGERLWSIPLIEDDDVATVGVTGVILLTREDDESVVTFFAPSE